VSAPTQHYHETKAALCLHQSSIIKASKRYCVCAKAALSGNQSGIVSAPKQHYHETKAALCLNQSSIIR
jgi:hypothetical protein